jgi:hypothetical protein
VRRRTNMGVLLEEGPGEASRRNTVTPRARPRSKVAALPANPNAGPRPSPAPYPVHTSTHEEIPFLTHRLARPGFRTPSPAHAISKSGGQPHAKLPKRRSPWGAIRWPDEGGADAIGCGEGARRGGCGAVNGGSRRGGIAGGAGGIGQDGGSDNAVLDQIPAPPFRPRPSRQPENLPRGEPSALAR